MMARAKNRAHDLAHYTFRGNESVLIDANVWLHLYPAPSDGRRPNVREYSQGLKAMLAAGVELMMDPIVLGEYLRAYCGIEWRALHRGKYPRFKRFRRSADFGAVGSQAAAFARAMLTQCTRRDHPFSKTAVDDVLTEFEKGESDFNDGALVETCRIHGWRLVTHDGDMTVGGIEVLTANRKLVAACS